MSTSKTVTILTENQVNLTLTEIRKCVWGVGCGGRHVLHKVPQSHSIEI